MSSDISPDRLRQRVASVFTMFAITCVIALFALLLVIGGLVAIDADLGVLGDCVPSQVRCASAPAGEAR